VQKLRACQFCVVPVVPRSCAVVGLCDGSAQIFDSLQLRSSVPKARASFEAHCGAVNSVHAVDAAADQTVCVSAGDDGVVRVWNAARGQDVELAATLQGASGAVTSARLDAEARFVVAGDSRGSASLWDVSNSHSASPTLPGSSKRSRPNSDGAVMTSAPFNPVAQLTVGRSDASSSTGSKITGVAWAAGESSVAVTSLDSTLRLLDVAAGLTVSTTLAAPRPFLALSASPLGSLFVTGHTDRALRVWDARGSRSVLRFDDKSSDSAWVSCVAWSPLSSSLVVSGGYDGCVALWDVRAPSAPLHRTNQHAAAVLAVAWQGADGAGIVSGGADARLRTSVLPAHSMAGR
jgi:WD40 repeat protein